MDKTDDKPKNLEIAILGAGCFWCTEAVFQLVRGVEKVEPGYAGGDLPNPTYEQVSSGTTGHVEVARITFDSDAISFREILEVFFGTHDPTQLNGQGADIGTQYRSVIFYSQEAQKTVAEKLIAELKAARAFENLIVTTVEPLNEFYPAETYHKDYFKRHPKAPYCQFVIAPKIEKLQKTFLSKLKVP